MKKKTSNNHFDDWLRDLEELFRGALDTHEIRDVAISMVFLLDVSRATDSISVPDEARWDFILANADNKSIGEIVDQALLAIECHNPFLIGVFFKNFTSIDPFRLGKAISKTHELRNRFFVDSDEIGRIYEYFLSLSADGKKGGEFYTPRCVVRLLVEMLEPFCGRIYDPCCGSAGMFVQSAEFIEANATGNGNGGRARADISIYGQEINRTSWRLAKMNLAIRGIDGQIAHGDTLHNDCFPDLKADFILANPPFNMKKWGGEQLLWDKRWKFGLPPTGNANFAWMQHIIHHLAPTGYAGVVMANGSMSSTQSGEGEIRKNIIEADLVDCMVALPDRLFYSTQIPTCLWILARDKSGRPPAGRKEPLRDRRGEVLFIDASKMGRMVDRTHRELTDEEIQKIARTYHAWRGEKDAGEYADLPGFCKSATLEEIRQHGYVLTPGRYVGAEIQEDDGEPFEEKMRRLVAELRQQQAEARRLDEAIARNLAELGFGVAADG